MKQYLRFIALLLLIVLSLSSCNNKNVGGETSAPESTAEAVTDNNKDKVTIATKGVSEYIIVRSENATDGIKKLASTLAAKIEEMTGAKIKVSDDWTNAAAGITESDTEILLGNTNRTQSDVSLGEGEYAVLLRNSKLVIMGSDEISLAAAVDYFVSLFEDDSDIILDPSFEYRSAIEYNIKSFTLCGADIREYKIVAEAGCLFIAEKFRAALAAATGISLEITNGAVRSEREIIFGNPDISTVGDGNYEKLQNSLSGYDACYGTTKTKLYFCFNDEAMFARVYSVFAGKYLSPANSDTDSITIESGVCEVYDYVRYYTEIN